MSKHTPGPWKFYQNETHQTDVTVFSENDGNGFVQGICRIDGVRGDRIDIQRANARLIAVAPEMLALLERMASWMDLEAETFHKNFDVDLQAIIAKAKGGVR